MVGVSFEGTGRRDIARNSSFKLLAGEVFREDSARGVSFGEGKAVHLT